MGRDSKMKVDTVWVSAFYERNGRGQEKLNGMRVHKTLNMAFKNASKALLDGSKAEWSCPPKGVKKDNISVLGRVGLRELKYEPIIGHDVWWRIRITEKDLLD